VSRKHHEDVVSSNGWLADSVLIGKMMVAHGRPEQHSAAQRRLEEGERQIKAQQSELEKLDLPKAEIRRGWRPS
jgi:hypothetical protein